MSGAALLEPGTRNVSALHTYISAACLAWFVIVWGVVAIGVTQLFRYYSKPPRPAVCATQLEEDEVPHVTVIRPVKGLEPRLYECLEVTFRLNYPNKKLTNVLCVSSRSDPALPILERLIRDFPAVDARITIEEEDPLLLKNRHALGPNPKIRNMSRAYREAPEGSIIWILDCNVWLGRGVCGRMVDLLCGYGGNIKYKFVHQTPLTIDLDSQSLSSEEREQLLGGQVHAEIASNIAASTSSDPRNHSRGRFRKLLQRGGGRLDEAFMSSAHAKFYNAINTVAVAPCVMGKSTMFRRSQLNNVTNTNPDRAPGIDFFSDNICEDHLIGDALWKKPQPFEKPGYQFSSSSEESEKWGKHAMLFGDLCFQPISHTSISACIDRRLRWLRVRKFTVTAATFVEPGTEAIVCSLYGAYALTTLPFASTTLSIPPTWLSFVLVWLASMTLWAAVDYIVYLLLHSAKTVELDAHTPDFILPQRSRNAYHQQVAPTSDPQPPPSPSLSAAPPADDTQPLLASRKSSNTTTGKEAKLAPAVPSLLDGARRGLREWTVAWLGREISALPIWLVAFWGGVTVEWRGRRFWVGLDMRVHEILES